MEGVWDLIFFFITMKMHGAQFMCILQWDFQIEYHLNLLCSSQCHGRENGNEF